MERLEVPLVEQAVCNQNLRDTHLGHFFTLDDSMMCAGGEKDADACRVSTSIAETFNGNLMCGICGDNLHL